MPRSIQTLCGSTGLPTIPCLQLYAPQVVRGLLRLDATLLVPLLAGIALPCTGSDSFTLIRELADPGLSKLLQFCNGFRPSLFDALLSPILACLLPPLASWLPCIPIIPKIAAVVADFPPSFSVSRLPQLTLFVSVLPFLQLTLGGFEAPLS